MTFTRRHFLLAGGVTGLLIARISDRTLKLGGAAAQPINDQNTILADWIQLARNGTVTLHCGQSEMGQGVFTGIGTLVAEELDCGWEQLRVETGPATDLMANIQLFRNGICPNAHFAREASEATAWDWVVTRIARVVAQQATGGSSSIMDRFVKAREAGAYARAILVATAALDWRVDTSTCVTKNGIVYHNDSRRQNTYGELAAAAAAGIQPPPSVSLKPRSAWKIVGRKQPPLPRVDVPAKSDGSAKFGIDVRHPGMLFAAVANCPVFGGRLKAFQPGTTNKLAGVVGVHEVPGGVAVVADSTWHAKKGLDALNVEWDVGQNALLNDQEIERRLADAFRRGLNTCFNRGNFNSVFAEAASRISAEYQFPYLAHATMEPMNCTAKVIDGHVEVWIPTQAQTLAAKAAATAAGVSVSQVQIHTPFLGGGFGRRAEVDLVSQAVTVAKAVGAPVQVIWSREEDMQHDFYRPAAIIRVDAAIAANGVPLALRHRIVSQSALAHLLPLPSWIVTDTTQFEGGAVQSYAIANQRVEYAVVDLPIPVGFWRAVGHSVTAFANECFIDELAHSASIDPLEYRLALLENEPRLKRLLSLAAEKAGWKTPLPKGAARGVAIHTSFSSAVAEIVEVAIGPGDELQVKRVVAAVDCGTLVNPDIVKAQVEGAIVFGLSAALWGKIAIRQGRVVQKNFPDYAVIRMKQAPVIDVLLVDTMIMRQVGLGKPAFRRLRPHSQMRFSLPPVRGLRILPRD